MTKQNFTTEEILWIREKMLAQAQCESDMQLEILREDALRVDFDGHAGILAAPDQNALARGFFLIARAAKEQKALKFTQTRRFEDCGVMLDMSRGGVMHVEALKKYLTAMAALGMNMAQLYTEDVYTVPEYPYFGYLRGRYTPEELREIDDFADKLGIEIVPCIQTLAHLGQFLQWKDNAHMQDQPTCLLIDDEDVYRFIEAEIRAVRGCLRSRRIHIGMDEAHGVGMGKYFEKHGLVNRFELLNRHLGRVVDICKKYGYETPMMWSDMFFRLGSKNNEYYDLDVHVPDEVIEKIPDVRLVYWDYYNSDKNVIDKMLAEHERMKPGTVFAGGIWTWAGFLPNIDLTNATMKPALELCLKYGIKTVMTTLWGDDGAETGMLLSLSMLPLFSESCWTGEVPNDETVAELGEAVSGIPREGFAGFRYFFNGGNDNRNGKGYLYCDLLYPLLVNEFSPESCAARLRLGEEIEKKYRGNPECDYAMKAMRLSAHKAEVIAQLRDRYLADDRAYLRKVAEEDIPALLEETDELMRAHKADWNRNFKRCGWEVLCLRYGGISARLEDVREEILDYLEGRATEIAELRDEPLPSSRKGGMQYYQVYVKPTFSYE